MTNSWSDMIRRYRLRHGLSQTGMGGLMNVSQRTVSRWERGEDTPGLAQQKRLRDLGLEPPDALLRNLSAAVMHCPVPRALSRTNRLQLVAYSKPALEKRPSIPEWVGRDLVEIACGVLEEMLDDHDLQRDIANKEIAGVNTTTRSVLRTGNCASIGLFLTTITYFFHEEMLFSDAISTPAPDDATCGYTAFPSDEFALDLGANQSN